MHFIPGLWSQCVQSEARAGMLRPWMEVYWGCGSSCSPSCPLGMLAISEDYLSGGLVWDIHAPLLGREGQCPLKWRSRAAVGVKGPGLAGRSKCQLWQTEWSKTFSTFHETCEWREKRRTKQWAGGIEKKEFDIKIPYSLEEWRMMCYTAQLFPKVPPNLQGRSKQLWVQWP